MARKTHPISKTVSAVVLGVGLLAPAARAELLVEPYVGYARHDGEQTLGGATTENEANSAIFGARLGFHHEGWMVGGDYSFSTYDMEFKTGGGFTEEEQEQHDLGVLAGYSWPLFRVWYTYYPLSKIEDQDGADVGSEYEGTGHGIAVGFKALPWMSVNAQVRRFEYDELENSVTGTSQRFEGDDELESYQYVLSASFPIKLGD